ncbi:MAG: LysM peptidoglycan-binding domain-containing protein [bacterium]|nr:LysM peptidoglycan-binding domain-containing protein [bacterium]
MKKFSVAVVLVAVLLAGPALAQTPPKNLKKVGDHWTPWDPPPAGPGAYIIVKGDTLWDLSGRWLGDPYLWPQIWDENRYILDSHWIYPGDPLVIPGRPTVVPDGGPPASAYQPETGPQVDNPWDADPDGEPVAAVPVLAPLLPVADLNDVYCSGYIEPEHEPSGLTITAADTVRASLAAGDVVHLNYGTNQGLKAGDRFNVIRDTGRAVQHPTSGEGLGSYIQRLGEATVMLVKDDSAMAVIEMTCWDVQAGDELVPYEEIPVPMMRGLPEFDRYSDPSGGATGEIVSTFMDLGRVGEGQIIHTDLGSASGVRPGEVLTLYEERGDLPRLVVGQAIVITVEALSSTAKITRSVQETRIGHAVEVVR